MTITTLLIALTLAALLHAKEDAPYVPQEYLYVWAGHADRTSPDLLVVLDFDSASPAYGEFVSVQPVLGPSAVNNEPHHAAFNVHKQRFYAGGLLSLLKAPGENDEIFGWAAQDPRQPSQLILENTTANPQRTGVPDEFVALQDGGFMVSMMGNAQGGSPGGVLYISPDGVSLEYPARRDLPKDDCFNPHGIAVDEMAGLVITGDFVTPSSLLQGPPHFCDSIRIWDLEEMKIVKTIHLEGAAGIMNINFIPDDHKKRFVATVPFDGDGNDVSLYVLDPEGHLHSTFHVTPYLRGPSGRCYSRINNAGTRMILATSVSGQIFILDITNLHKISVLDVQQVAIGMHFIAFNKDQTRVAISGYFLDMDKEGVVHQDGDRSVHIYNIEKDKFVEEVEIEFGDIDGEPYRPHGMDVWWPTDENMSN